MNSENYKQLLKKHVEESEQGITHDLIKKHKYELAIFPKINEFKLGEHVHMPKFNEYGFIENFNSDGTLFIKINISDLGRDYSPIFVKKIESKEM